MVFHMPVRERLPFVAPVSPNCMYSEREFFEHIVKKTGSHWPAYAADRFEGLECGWHHRSLCNKGKSVILPNNGTDDIEISSNGSFPFEIPLLDGTAYDVTVIPPPPCPSDTCAIYNGSGVLSGENVMDVRIELSDFVFGDGYEAPLNTITKVDDSGDVGE